jgi:hypothetical protein
MKVHLGAGMLVGFVVLALGASAAAKPMSDGQIRKAIVSESIASYPGNCPCPYNSARNGSSCGARSAYSRPGGYAPKCYPSDITKSEVDAYRRDHVQSGQPIGAGAH